MSTLTANKQLPKMEWAATFLLVLGAIIISVSPQMATSWEVFAGFLMGHLIWLGVGIARRMSSLIAMNAGMALLDIYAILVRLY